jgi:hypothetical protein
MSKITELENRIKALENELKVTQQNEKPKYEYRYLYRYKDIWGDYTYKFISDAKISDGEKHGWELILTIKLDKTAGDAWVESKYWCLHI